ncbi:MAG: class I fructose-bisphosphate aldolase, partial [Rubrivivax sp.]
MVMPGLRGPDCDAVDAVADATVRTLRRTVPAAVAGVAFLSGGQSADAATARLKATHARHATARARCPLPLTFSFGRALQDEALAAWAGDDANREAARSILLRRARSNGAALLDAG